MNPAVENWLHVIGYEGIYEVSSHGNVRNSKGKLLTPTLQYRSHSESAYRSYSNPYYVVTLYKDGVKKKHRVHRLVAKSFIPNPQGYDIVNHIDEKQYNNHYLNLEWCTVSQNTKHSAHKWTGDNHYSKKEERAKRSPTVESVSLS